ncbi:MAG: TolC family protein [Proteobacteria bacterium]|nr:TolC family protein [Pseudomonadota bacterium]
MKTLAAFLGTTLFALSASAQPKAPTPKAPVPTTPVAPPVVAPQPATDDMATFEKELGALFAANGLTSEQAAQRARTASPTVRRKVAEVDVAIAQAEQAELARVPQVGAKVQYTRLSSIDQPMIAPGFSFPVYLNSYAATAQVGVNLSDYVLRYPALVDGAKLGLETARISRRSAEVSAGQEARLSYYEWVRAKLQVLISTRQLAQVRATLGQVRALAEAQRLSKADLMRVESQEAQAEQVVDQLQNLALLREEQLRLITGATPEDKFEIGEDVRQDIVAPGAAPLDQLMTSTTQQRLEFKVLDTGIKAKEKQLEAEKAGQYPKLTAFAAADFSNPNQRIFPQKDEFNLTWSAGLAVSWTLNETLIARANDRRIRAETSELRADRENLERGARIEVLAAQQAVAIAQHALTTSQKGLDAATEGYRVRRELLNAERATAVELVDAETDLTRARITALNARVDLRVAMAQLAHALGNDTTSK